MATINDIADAVVSELNAGHFSRAVQASRCYRPRYELEELDDLHVSVIPAGGRQEAASRGDDVHTDRVQVGVQQRVRDTGPGELDPLIDLVEEIQGHFKGWSVPGTGAQCTTVSVDPLFSPDHLARQHVFTSVLTLEFTRWSF